jgi:hypothetical protein
MQGKDGQAQAVEYTWPSGAQGVVTFSFDDGFDATSQATVACLQERCLCATYNIITDYVESVFEGLPTATWSQWQEINRMGHEIASHGAAHVALAGPFSDIRRLLKGFWTAPDGFAYAGRIITAARFLGKRLLYASTSSNRRSPLPFKVDRPTTTRITHR